MKIVIDTNIIVRLLVKDDVKQFNAVFDLFKNAEEIIIPTHVFCELVWTLSSGYKFSHEDIYTKVKSVLKSNKVVAKEDEVEAGLMMMEKGGDFADGVNEYSGRQIANGSSVFVTFDKRAVRIFSELGIAAMEPA